LESCPLSNPHKEINRERERLPNPILVRLVPLLAGAQLSCAWHPTGSELSMGSCLSHLSDHAERKKDREWDASGGWLIRQEKSAKCHYHSPGYASCASAGHKDAGVAIEPPIWCSQSGRPFCGDRLGPGIGKDPGACTCSSLQKSLERTIPPACLFARRAADWLVQIGDAFPSPIIKVFGISKGGKGCSPK
jgi:hypothetical protein